MQGSDLEIELLSVSNVLSKFFRMSSCFVGAGMLYQATKAFVYEEEQAKGNIQRTVLLVRALNTIGLDNIKPFWKEVCLTGIVPVLGFPLRFVNVLLLSLRQKLDPSGQKYRPFSLRPFSYLKRKAKRYMPTPSETLPGESDGS